MAAEAKRGCGYRWTMLLVGLALSGAVSTDAGAGQLHTTFEFEVSVGDAPWSPLRVPTLDGQRVILPLALDDWNCGVTDIFATNDGLSVYHNVFCTSASTSTTVGQSVACRKDRQNSDYGGFFLRAGGARVSFQGNCATTLTPATSASPSVKL